MENQGIKLPRLGMGKMRSDSTWAALTPEQRETLEGWLFEENLGYTGVLERAQKEFGITATKMSLSRFHQRVAAERAKVDLLDLEKTVKDMQGMEVNWHEMNAAAMSLIIRQLMKITLESPDKVREMAWLGHVLVASEAQAIKRGWLTLGRMKAELDVAAECIEHKTDMDIILGDESLDEQAQVLKVREALFEKKLPRRKRGS